MPKLSRKRALLLKTESSYAVDPTPTGAANAILVRNLNIRPLMNDFVPRELVRPYLGNFESLPDESWCEVTFEVEMAGSSGLGVAPPWGAVMTSCAMLETIQASTSVTYAPQSDDGIFKSSTLYFSIDGLLQKVTGARGNFEADISIKGIPVWKFRFVGIYSTPTDTADPTPTYTGFQLPLVAGKTNTTPFTLHGFAGCLASFTMNQGNVLAPRALIGCTKEVAITDRKTVGSFFIEAPAISAKDFYTIIAAATKGAMTITHGTVATNKVTISAPSSSMQLFEPEYEDVDGVQMLRMNANFTPVSGNDEFSIVVA